MDLTAKSIRLYETCEKCEGLGRVAENKDAVIWEDCPECDGKGSITTEVKFEELTEAFQAIAEGAANAVLAKKAERREPMPRERAEPQAARIFKKLRPGWNLRLAQSLYVIQDEQPERKIFLNARIQGDPTPYKITVQHILEGLLRGLPVAVTDKCGGHLPPVDFVPRGESFVPRAISADRDATTLFEMMGPGWSVRLGGSRYTIIDDQPDPTVYLRGKHEISGEILNLDEEIIFKAILAGESLGAHGPPKGGLTKAELDAGVCPVCKGRRCLPDGPQGRLPCSYCWGSGERPAEAK